MRTNIKIVYRIRNKYYIVTLDNGVEHWFDSFGKFVNVHGPNGVIYNHTYPKVLNLSLEEMMYADMMEKLE